MKLKFLGTGAADFSELLKTEEGFKLNDKSVRRSSSILVNDDLLIDCGPHTFLSLKKYGVDIKKIKYLLITHTHGDHFNVQAIQDLAKLTDEKLMLVVNKDANINIDGINVLGVSHLQNIELGDYKIKVLPANHENFAVHYDIEKNGEKLFYGLDGAWLMTDEMNAMRNRNYDILVLDATVGEYVGDYRVCEHNSLPMLRILKPTLFKNNACNENSLLILSHLARTLHEKHETVEKKEIGDGFTVAYDGLEIIK